MTTGPFDLGGYLIVAAIVTGAWWYAHGDQHSVPHQSAGTAASAVEHYRQDLATAHRSAARRLRSGEIKTESDLHTFIKFGEHKARQRSFAALDQVQAELSGNNWSPGGAAQLCDRLATDLGR